jgi:predicted nucleic acid-binding protein
MRGDFFDSNVLIYAASADDRRFETAQAALASGGTISVQVLNEFVNVARRKMGLDWPPILNFLTGVRDLLKVEAVDIEAHERALQIAERYRLSISDAMIVSSALIAGCSRLVSEDMQHGLMIEGGVTIYNPFLA